jgi:hypothetical protein
MSYEDLRVMKNIEIDVPKKRKPGYSRKPDGEVTPDALRMRRYQERKSTEAKLPELAAAAAVAAIGVLCPKGDVQDELRELAQRSAAEASRLLMTEGPLVIRAAIDKAKDGDVGAMALLLKHCISSKTTVTLPNAQGRTIEETADSIIAAATAGRMTVDDASMVLKLLEQHSTITLSAGLTARLSALNAQLESARATGVIEASATLQRAPRLSMEDVL